MKKFLLKTRERSRPNWKTKRFWILVLIIFVSGFLLPGFFGAVGSKLLTPVDVVRVWLHESTSSFPYYYRSRNELIIKINDLEREIASYSGMEMSLRNLRHENRELRDKVNIKQIDERVLSQVIARPDDLPYDLLQLDKGRVDGILLHAPVFKGQDQIIGYISHVNEKTSFATLLTSPGQKSTAYILESRVFAVAEGVGAGVLRVRLPQGIDLNVGDLVIFPVVDSGFFGSISYIETEPTQPQKYGYVTLGNSLQSLRYVTISKLPIKNDNFSEVVDRISDMYNQLFYVDVPIDFDFSTTSHATSSEIINADFIEILMDED